MARNRLTLLEIVQEVLSKMNHDNVNTIDQTIESRQIAKEARVVYYDLMDRDDWPHLIQLKQLEGISDSTRPNMMQIPENATTVTGVRYETTQTTDDTRIFKDIYYLEPNDFLDLCFMRRTDQDNVTVVKTFNNVELFILNDQPPTYWTTFDDNYIVFDSYDSDVETTMHSAKGLALMKIIPEWQESDTFVPDMPDQMFSAFLAELTSASSIYWKQGASPKDDQRAARSISRLRKDARKTDGKLKEANFGRRQPNHYVRSESGERGSIRNSYT